MVFWTPHITEKDLLYGLVFILVAYSLYLGLSMRAFRIRLADELLRRRLAEQRSYKLETSLGVVRNALETDGYTPDADSEMAMCGGCGLMKTKREMDDCEAGMASHVVCPSFQKTLDRRLF